MTPEDTDTRTGLDREHDPRGGVIVLVVLLWLALAALALGLVVRWWLW